MDNPLNLSPQQIDMLRTMASQFGGWQGQVYPQAKRTYQQPPAFESKFEVGKENGRYSTAKIWAHEPTQNHPNHAIFFALNCKTSAFFKFRSLAELNDFITWLSEVHKKLESIIPSLQAKEVIIANAQQAYDMVSKIEGQR